MKISKRQLAKIIRENLLLEAPSPFDAQVVFEQLFRGDRAIQGQKLSRAMPFIKQVVNRGIVGSTGTIYRGGDAVAYLAHRILPRVYTAQGVAPGSATAVKNTLTIMKHFAPKYNFVNSLLSYRVVSGPNYAFKLLNTKMGQSIINLMPKVSQGTNAIIRTAESAGALRAPAAQITKAVQAAKPATRAIASAAQAMKVTLNTSPEAVALAKELGKKYATSGAALSKTPGASQAAEKLAAEAAKQSSKLGSFFSVLGKAAVVLMVVDAFYQPYNLFANGELWGFKLGIGVKDMDTPWGQLAYRKRVGMPPAKPSDFNKQYKNLLATIIYNSKKEGPEVQVARDFVKKANEENLLNMEAWEAYIAPWKEAADEIKEAENALASEEDTDAGDLDDLGLIDEDALTDIGEDTGENISDNEEQARSDSEESESSPRSSNSSISKKVSKVQRLIGMRPDGEWSRDVNIKLGAFAVAESFSDDKKVKTTPDNLEWWKDWKNSAPKIEKITVGGRNMTFGTAGNPALKGNIDSLIKVLEFVKDSRESMNENFSRGTLLRRRYRKLY